MNVKLAVVVGASTALFSAAGAQAQFLLVPNFSSGKQSIALFNSTNGALINPKFIVGDANNVFSSPREAIEVGHQIWICDQVANKVFRYDLDTNSFLPAITGNATNNLSNIRGMELVGNTMYVANAGTGFGNAIVTIDVPTATVTGSFAVTSGLAPWDVQAYNGNLLVSNYSSSSSGNSRIDVYSTGGAFLSNLVLTTNNQGGLFGPQQITVEGNGNLLVGGFSGSPLTASGVYEYTGAGSNVGFYASGLGPRGGYRLGNGNIMYTKGDGVWSWDPVQNLGTSLWTGLNQVNATYISPVSFIPTPGTGALVGMAGMLSIRRRR